MSTSLIHEHISCAVVMVVVSQQDERESILKQAHDGHGHFGIHASWSRLYREFWWPRSYTDLKEYVLSCVPCQLYAPIYKNPATIAVSTMYLFEKFALDFAGPLPVTKNGNMYILVAVEMFTSWPIAITTKSTEAKVVPKILYKNIFFCQFGLPTHILTDNGSSFDNEIVDGILFLAWCQFIISIPPRIAHPPMVETNK